MGLLIPQKRRHIRNQVFIENSVLWKTMAFGLCVHGPKEVILRQLRRGVILSLTL